MGARLSRSEALPEPFFGLRGADFGHSVISSDRQRVFFSHPEGPGSLDLDTRAVSIVARHPHAPTREPASPDSETQEERPPVIAPLQLSADGLIVAIGTPPTFADGEWELSR